MMRVKKGVVIGIVVGVVVLVALFLVLNHEPSSSNTNRDYFDNNLPAGSNEQQGVNEARGNGPVESDEDCDIAFTEYLIDPKYVQKVGQVGVVHGGGKSIVERSYISVKQEFQEQQIPIYAPTDMAAIAGAHYMVSNDPNYMPDYVLKFDAGCNVEVLLGHLKGVAESIDEQMTPLKNDSREDWFRPIRFKAGEQIGYYYQQASGGVSGFDFVVRDRRVINKFINQERYSNDRARNLISGVCPYDYYTGEKKEAYYNLLGAAGGTIFQVKDCGTASRDLAGTISGMWFLSKDIKGTIYDDYSEGDYGSPISITGDEESVTLGNLGQSPTLKVYSLDNPTYKLPTQVTTEHCYQFYSNPNSKQGYAYFKLIDESTMEAYYSASGTCPTAFPTGNAKRYYK